MTIFRGVERTIFVNNIRNASGPLSSFIKFKLIAKDDTIVYIEKRFLRRDPFFKKYMNDNDAVIRVNVKGDILLQFVNFFEFGNLRINPSMIHEYLRAADIFLLKELVLMISYRIWNKGIPFINQSTQFYSALNYATQNQLSILREKLIQTNAKTPAKSKTDNEESPIYKKQKLYVSKDDVIILDKNNSPSTSTLAGISGNENSPDLNTANSLSKKSKCNSQSSSSPTLLTLKKRKCVNKSGRNGVKVPKDLKCQICNKLFANSQKYRAHSYEVHKYERINCPICNKSFNKFYISHHMSVYCKKTEINKKVKIGKVKKSVKPDLKNKIGSIKGKFDCSYCSKTFKNYQVLEVHERIHNGKKPFKCKKCPFRCNQVGNLANHERTHTQERPFKCDYCKEGFTQLSSLNWHKDKHHKFKA